MKSKKPKIPKKSYIKKVAIIATGGTIAKTYDGENMVNQKMVIDDIVGAIRLPYLKIKFIDLFKFDSLELTDQHRQQIAKKTLTVMNQKMPAIITHGTDTMVTSGKFIDRYLKKKNVKITQPIIMTGSMMPYSVKNSDSLQNIVEALLASKILTAGIYLVFHNHVFSIEDVQKNYQLKTFTNL